MKHFRTFFRIEFGTRKVSGKFPSEKSISENSMRNFAEIGCIFTYRKPEKPKKKDVFRGISVFGIFDDFSEIFHLYRFYPNFTSVNLLRRGFWKHRKCTNFSGISDLEPGKIFPGNFRAVFFFPTFSFFPEFPNFGNRTKFLRNLHSAHC
jgi:hypothetical protein